MKTTLLRTKIKFYQSPNPFLEQKICDLDLEFICKYGPLGYGYSHQLHGLSEKTPAQEVEDSVFFRLPGIDVSQIHSSLSIFSLFDNFSLNVILGTKRYR